MFFRLRILLYKRGNHSQIYNTRVNNTISSARMRVKVFALLLVGTFALREQDLFAELEEQAKNMAKMRKKPVFQESQVESSSPLSRREKGYLSDTYISPPLTPLPSSLDLPKVSADLALFESLRNVTNQLLLGQRKAKGSLKKVNSTLMTVVHSQRKATEEIALLQLTASNSSQQTITLINNLTVSLLTMKSTLDQLDQVPQDVTSLTALLNTQGHQSRELMTRLSANFSQLVSLESRRHANLTNVTAEGVKSYFRGLNSQSNGWLGNFHGHSLHNFSTLGNDLDFLKLSIHGLQNNVSTLFREISRLPLEDVQDSVQDLRTSLDQQASVLNEAFGISRVKPSKEF